MICTGRCSHHVTVRCASVCLYALSICEASGSSHPATESRHCGLYVVLLFLIFMVGRAMAVDNQSKIRLIDL